MNLPTIRPSYIFMILGILIVYCAHNHTQELIGAWCFGIAVFARGCQWLYEL
jgi:hypothetical protein